MRAALLLLLPILPPALAAQQDAMGDVFLFQEVPVRPKLQPGSVLYYPHTPDTTSGVVTVTLVVDTLGRVDPHSIRIMRSPSPAFTAAARAMVLSQSYSPGQLDQKRVQVLMQQDIRFRPGTVSCATVVIFEGVELCADSTTGRR